MKKKKKNKKKHVVSESMRVCGARAKGKAVVAAAKLKTSEHTRTHKHTQAHTSTHKHTQAHTSTHKHTQAHLLTVGPGARAKECEGQT